MENSRNNVFVLLMPIIFAIIILIIPLIFRKHKCYDKEKNKAIFISIANSLICFLIFLCFETIINSYSALKYYAFAYFIAIFVCYKYLTNKTDIEIRKEELKQSYENIAENNNSYPKVKSLSEKINTDLYYISQNFNSNNNDIAYSLIENKLIPDLINSNNIDNVKITFEILIDEKVLSKDEANKFSIIVMNQIKNME